VRGQPGRRTGDAHPQGRTFHDLPGLQASKIGYGGWTVDALDDELRHRTPRLAD
jgi:hypothetical protein